MFITCSLNNSHFFINFLSLYTSCLYSLSLDNNIVGFEKFDEICSITFFVLNDISILYYIYKSFLLKIQDHKK